MRITDLLPTAAVTIGGSATTKTEAIDSLVGAIVKTGAVTDPEAYRAAVYAREAEATTAMGEGVAIPHGKSAGVARPALAALTLKAGVDADSPDGLPATMFFLIAAPESQDNVHLDVLARLATLLIDDDFRDGLYSAHTPAEFLAVIDAAEQARFASEADPAESAPTPADPAPGVYRLLGVTACPTGIAHTYMAAEKLEQAAAARGVVMKVETDGSVGVKNALTPQEIAQADAIIVAADKDVEPARFHGKPVIFASVADGIHKADDLISRALDGQVPVYQDSTGRAAGQAAGGQDSAGRKVYKSLMNGVSFMLPFVIGGGILIALSFLVDSANAGTSSFGSGNPAAALLNQVGSLAFGVMFPILAGYIAMAIGDRPALMPGMVGGFIAKAGVSATLPQDEWVSAGFFGALIAGFAAGYIVVLLRKLFDRLPKALEGTKPTLLFPVCGILLIGLLMVFVVNPPMALFNTWLNGVLLGLNTGSKLVLGLILGGMMSIDFGGPLNKAAYVFGTAAIATGAYGIMGSVMIGGMVPPIAIGLALLVFKNRFTEDERNTTITDFIMGLSFITEAAIPFATTDPGRVIPSCVAGSAVAGGLSMLFGCGSPAPHGGIFVIAIIDKPLLYLVALAAGSLVSMLLLGILKKPLPQNVQPAQAIAA
ncbi:MAG: fructose-specific PTS transporter subunit EIIC [Propionibacteriaceae bacterium]|jgi:PTS system fructose-specific IIC component|nr:fructose-specific PTS transporter subunit EIIC [Propionibacteriaceae bacterium]